MRHDKEYLLAPKTQIVPCRDCGAAIEVGWKTKLPQRCVDCGAARLAETCIAISKKTGPEYRRWLRGQFNRLLQMPGGYEELTEILPLYQRNC